ncbi:hypothetical protein BJV78DRAFT_1157748 [Lactifluus subvellereus]|nr:hypothetical protein BJV78DRAFT_1157748 [Lactifluus subvellereus]
MPAPSTTRVDSFDKFLGLNEPWQLTVLRSQNLGMLRPERSRPIITLEVDGQHKHEVILGTDGQNPNQRDIILLSTFGTNLRVRPKACCVGRDAPGRCHEEAGHRPTCAFTRSSPRAMLTQPLDVELRLSDVPAARKKSVAQKYQPCASLLTCLRPPPSVMSPLKGHESDEDDLSVISSVTDDHENPPPWTSAVSEEPPSGLRRRKVTGYCINSEEECSSESDCCISEGEVDDAETCDPWEPPISYDDKSSTIHSGSFEIRKYTRTPSIISIILPSLFPQTHVTDNVSVASFASSASDTLTCHRELREARVDSDFDRILVRLISEWYFTGASVSMAFIVPVRGLGLLSIPASLRHRVDISVKLLVLLPGLIILHSVDTGVFGYSENHVDSVAKRFLIISCVAAAIGLFINAWFIFAYSGADVRKLQTLAVDIYGSYFFFALSSRLPLLALFIAVLALVGFLGVMAWTAWPTAVLVMCAFAGVLVSLQFIVYSVHRIALYLVWILRGVWLGAGYVGNRVRGIFVRGQAQGSDQAGEAQGLAKPGLSPDDLQPFFNTYLVGYLLVFWFESHKLSGHWLGNRVHAMVFTGLCPGQVKPGPAKWLMQPWGTCEATPSVHGNGLTVSVALWVAPLQNKGIAVGNPPWWTSIHPAWRLPAYCLSSLDAGEKLCTL